MRGREGRSCSKPRGILTFWGFRTSRSLRSESCFSFLARTRRTWSLERHREGQKELLREIPWKAVLLAGGSMERRPCYRDLARWLGGTLSPGGGRTPKQKDSQLWKAFKSFRPGPESLQPQGQTTQETQ